MLIVFEGLEGVGKSSLALACAKALRGATYLKNPPPGNDDSRTRIHTSGNPEAYFYYYVSQLILVQPIIQTVARHPDRHTIVDRYLHSTIANFAQGLSFDPPIYNRDSIIDADLTVHITCSERQRSERRVQRGLHEFERPQMNSDNIDRYYAFVADISFLNSESLDTSVRRLMQIIRERLHLP